MHSYKVREHCCLRYYVVEVRGTLIYRISQFRLLLCIRQFPDSILCPVTTHVSHVSSGLFMCKCIKMLEAYLKTVNERYLENDGRDI